MKKFFLPILLFLSLPAMAQYQHGFGFCEQGGKTVVTSRQNGSPQVMASYPFCTVDVYNTGTSTHATIYNASTGGAKSNPFTALANATYSFYVAAGTYDIKLSGTMSVTYLTQINIGSGGGSGSVTGVSVTTANGFQPSVTSPTTTPVITINVDGTHYLPTTTDRTTWNAKQGAITLTTTGTGGAATFTSGTLNIPQYQRVITLTTTGSSGAATFDGTTLNIPNYAGGGSSAFSAITTGVNTTASMQCGTGCVITPVSTGIVNANEINLVQMSILATGILKNTTGTGVPSIAVAGDFPTLNQNTTGTSSNLSGTPPLPNGTTATTQSPGDNTTKLATTAFVIANGGGGSGTVTSVSVTTANGVSGSVATATTTPAITLALGAITPASVAASGAVSGTTLSAGSGSAACGAATGCSASVEGSTAGTPTAANDYIRADSTLHTFVSSVNGGSEFRVPQVIASGTSALGTSAISSGACATVVTTSATGVASTDAISWNPNASIKAVTGYTPATTGGLSITGYPTANNVNWDVCNWSNASITPGAVTLNWRVAR